MHAVTMHVSANVIKVIYRRNGLYRYGQTFAVIMKLLIGGTLTEFENQPHTP